MAALKNTSSSKALMNDIFHGSFQRHQNWSFPDSIIYYISKNPSSSKCYQKLVQCCKYFYFKNPIVILRCLHLHSNICEACSTNGSHQEISYEKPVCKFWIEYDVFADARTSSNIFSAVASRLYRTTELNFTNCVLNLNEFQCFASTAVNLMFRNVTVKYENGDIVEFEKLIEFCPNLNTFRFTFSTTTSMSISSQTVPNLIKVLQNLPNLKKLALHNLPKIFDLKTFFNDFIKKNNQIEIVFRFDVDFDSEYRNQVMEIVNEILGTSIFNYKCPLFMVCGLTKQIQDLLFEKFSCK